MAGCKCGSMLFSIVGLMLLMVVTEKSLVQAGKAISGDLDVVVVLYVGATSKPWMLPDHETKALKDAYTEFIPKNFEIGQGKARVGAVQLTAGEPGISGHAEKIISNLNTDAGDFQRKIEAWTPSVSGQTNRFEPDYIKALDAIKTVFSASTNRVKIVVMVLNSFITPPREPTIELIKSLRQSGVWFYAIAVRTESQDFQVMTLEAETFTGAPRNVIKYEEGELTKSSLLNALDKVKSAITFDLCGWDSMCRYLELGKRCSHHTWKVGTSRSNINCGDLEPNKQCSEDDCRRECDEKWPWDSQPPDCSKSECATVKRRTPEPPVSDQTVKDLLKQCPPVFTCPCTSSSTTTTTSSTTSPTAGNTSPIGKSASESSTIYTEKSSTEPQSAKPSTIKAPAANSTRTSTNPGGNSPTGGDQLKKATHGHSHSDEGSTSLVIAIVVVVIVVVVIVLIIVGTVVSLKRRKNGTKSRKSDKLVDKISSDSSGKENVLSKHRPGSKKGSM